MPSPRKSCCWKSDGSSLTCADCGWITVDLEVVMSIACKVWSSVTSLSRSQKARDLAPNVPDSSGQSGIVTIEVSGVDGVGGVSRS
jgi:hypothetical protein